MKPSGGTRGGLAMVMVLLTLMALLVLCTRALAYAVAPSPLARVLERSAGGPSLVTVALVSLGVAATVSILVVWLASLGVHERARLRPERVAPSLRLRRLALRAVALYVSHDSLNRNYQWVQDKFLPRSAEFIKTTITEDAPQLGKDGLMAQTTRATIHAWAGAALLAVLALKILVVRWWRALDRFLPAFGITVFALFLVTFVTSAGDYLIRG